MSELFPNLADSVAHWLEYQKLVKKEELFCESYLAQPVGEFLITHFPEKQFKPEYQGLPFKERKTRGRPASIDYVMLNRDNKQTVGKRMAIAIEAKWVSSNQLNAHLIFFDVFRLRDIRNFRENNPISCYFLICGKRTDIEKNFINRTLKNNSDKRVFTEHFPTTKNNVITWKTTDDTQLKKYYDQYRKGKTEHAKNQMPEDIELKVKLFGKKETENFQVFLWEVQLKQGRSKK